MMISRFTSIVGVLLVGTLLASMGRAQQGNPPPPVPPVPEGVDVLARGPVHEAYAEPTDVQPQPSPLVTRQPPDPINEIPPDQRPEGNVVWIPGYWNFDQVHSDYVWVSGFWRIPPPGRKWVPGTWQAVEGGWHWVPGFWAPDNQVNLQYLPAPPPSIDAGPTVPAPAVTSIYVPGIWIYRDRRFLWRPGFWTAFHPGWVWIPAHYVWTPVGFVFVEGYWDHPLDRRGLLFAPVLIARRLWAAPRFRYVPQYVVQPDFLLTALFVFPRSGHYFFGDYFEEKYRRAGLVPWVDFRIGRAAYDPNFAYYRHGYADTHWARNLEGLYAARFNGTIARPPHSWVQQREVVRKITNVRNKAVSNTINITHFQNVQVLAPINQVHNLRITHLSTLAGGKAVVEKVRLNPSTVRLQAVTGAQQRAFEQHARQLHGVAVERRQAEARILMHGTPPLKFTDRPQMAKIQLPRHPLPPRVVKPMPKLPSAPVLPRHIEKPLPRYEPPRRIQPPRPHR